MDAQRVIAESRPMLEEFLCDIGLHRVGEPLDFPELLGAFSRWVDAQEVTEDDRYYLASRLGAFMCEYLIAVRMAQRAIVNGRIVMRVPIGAGSLREFDPYAVAVAMVTSRRSLRPFLETLCS
jgi:hypothetical protein